MVNEGYRLNSVTLGAAQDVLEIKGHFYGVILETITLKVPGGLLNKESYLIGVSFDQGTTWSFIEGENMQEETLKKILPELAGKLVLPVKKEPVFMPQGNP